MNEINATELNAVAGAGLVKDILTGLGVSALYDSIRSMDLSGGQTNSYTDAMGNMS